MGKVKLQKSTLHTELMYDVSIPNGKGKAKIRKVKEKYVIMYQFPMGKVK